MKLFYPTLPLAWSKRQAGLEQNGGTTRSTGVERTLRCNGPLYRGTRYQQCRWNRSSRSACSTLLSGPNHLSHSPLLTGWEDPEFRHGKMLQCKISRSGDTYFLPLTADPWDSFYRRRVNWNLYHLPTPVSHLMPYSGTYFVDHRVWSDHITFEGKSAVRVCTTKQIVNWQQTSKWATLTAQDAMASLGRQDPSIEIWDLVESHFGSLRHWSVDHMSLFHGPALPPIYCGLVPPSTIHWLQLLGQKGLLKQKEVIVGGTVMVSDSIYMGRYFVFWASNRSTLSITQIVHHTRR